MREIDLAGTKLAIKSGPWALVVYEDQLNRHMYEDFERLMADFEQNGHVDLVALLRIIWGDARAANGSLPDYEPWVKALPDDALDGVATDWSDTGVFGQVAADWSQAFFRTALRGREAVEG